MPDDLYIQAADDSIEKYQLVFKGIFEHTDNMGHYNMMMGVQS
jgi:wobble nucleotide-excising tRNase